MKEHVALIKQIGRLLAGLFTILASLSPVMWLTYSINKLNPLFWLTVFPFLLVFWYREKIWEGMPYFRKWLI